MNATLVSRDEAHALRENAPDLADTETAEYWAFRDALSAFLASFGSCDDSGCGRPCCFSMIPKDEDFDLSEFMIVVSTTSSGFSIGMLSQLSEWIKGQERAFPVYFDAEVDRRRPFEIVVLRDGRILGSEDTSTRFLSSLGFTEEKQKA